MQCPSCGNTVQANATACDACGTAIPSANAAPQATQARGWGTKDAHTFDCENCGAQTVFSAAQMSMECPYCGSTKVVELSPEKQADVVAPEYVVPFKIQKERSGALFRAWAEGLWFAPGDLKQRAAAGQVRGVYLPFWVYDVDTKSYFRGEWGKHYHVDEKGPDGQTRKVQKTRWQPGSGWRTGRHEDVLVCASHGVERKLVEAIEPWNMAERQAYAPGFLAGWEAERYQVDQDVSWREFGRKRVEEKEQRECEQRLRVDHAADTVRNVSVDVRFENLRSRHMLLPAFISAYSYQGKTFKFMINGQTGEVQGERPWSTAKILACVGAVIAAIVLAVVLSTAARKPKPQPGQPSQPTPVEQPIAPG